MHVEAVKADGNCLFRALALQVHGDEDKHAQIRFKCCDYMLAHEEDFVALFQDSKSFREYVESRRQPVKNGVGEWGDDPEIRVCEELLDRPILVFDVDAGVAEPMVTHLEDALPKSVADREPLRLSYKGRKHFDAVVRDAAVYPLGVLGSTDLLDHRKGGAELAGFTGVQRRKAKKGAAGASKAKR